MELKNLEDTQKSDHTTFEHARLGGVILPSYPEVERWAFDHLKQVTGKAIHHIGFA